MISEKTIELNLTTEMLNWLGWITKKVHYTLAPSQIEEGVCGFDAAVIGSGGSVLIQYKRAYVDGSIWTWKLNRTKRRDQHLRLSMLEEYGFEVLYAFPYFHKPNDIAKWRRRLLTKTYWFPPSYIRPKGGPIGHHDVNFDAKTGRWWVSSEEHTDIRPPENEGIIADYLDRAFQKNNIVEYMHVYNRIMYHMKEPDVFNDEYDDDMKLASAQSLLLRPNISAS